MTTEEKCAHAREKLAKKDAAGALAVLDELNILHLTEEQIRFVKALFEEIPQEARERSAHHCMQSLLLARELGDDDGLRRWHHALTALRDRKKPDAPARSRLDYYLGCAALARPETDNAQLMMTIAILYNDGQVNGPDLFLSATGKRPGVLQGAKDLSHWGKNHRAVSTILQPMLGAVLPFGGEGAAEAASAELLYDKNDLNGATLYLPAATGARDPEVQFAGLAVLARICRLDRQTRSPEVILQQIGEVLQQKQADWLIPNYEALCVQFDISAGRLDKVREWIEKNPARKPGSCCRVNRYRLMVRAQAMLALGRDREAALLSEELLLSIQHEFAPLDKLECLLDGAIACERIGSREKAMQKVAQAVEIAEDYGYIRVFADRGRPMLALLTAYLKEEATGEKRVRYVRALAEAAKNFSLSCPALYAPVQEEEEPAVQLTQTEVQLLHLLADGNSNRQIGEELGIKLSTVKFHLHNLFEKLGVTSRTEALSAAKRCEIL